MNVRKEVAALEPLTVNDLHARYVAFYGEGTNARQKQWLVRRIVWRRGAGAGRTRSVGAGETPCPRARLRDRARRRLGLHRFPVMH